MGPSGHMSSYPPTGNHSPQGCGHILWQGANICCHSPNFSQLYADIWAYYLLTQSSLRSLLSTTKNTWKHFPEELSTTDVHWMLLSHRVTIHPSLTGTFPILDWKSWIPGDSLAPGKPGWSPYVSHHKITPTAAPPIWERRIPYCILMFLNLLGKLFGARRAYLACPHCVFGGEGGMCAVLG